MAVYITKNKPNAKKIYEEEWSSSTFVVYQKLYIHIEDENIKGKPYVKKVNNERNNLIHYGGNYWQLPYYNEFEDKKKENDRNEAKIGVKDIKPSLGIVTIAFDRKDGTHFERDLYIAPSVLTAEELQEMAIHISRLIFNHKSFTLSNMNVPTARNTNQGKSLSASIQDQKLVDGKSNIDNFLENILNFLNILDKNLKQIAQQPAFSMRSEKQIIPINKSKKPKDMIQRKLNPYKKLTLSYAKTYDDLSLENQWLGYIVFEFLYKNIQNLIDQLQEDFIKTDFNNDNKKRIDKNQKNIDDIKKKFEDIKSISFLSKFNLKLKKEPIITTRLTTRNGYAEIFNAYQKLFSSHFIKAFNFHQSVVESYSQGYVDNLSNIYEYWTLFIIYDNLLNLGFQPKDNDLDDLDDCIQLKDNQLELPSETKVTLVKELSKNKKVEIDLYYEPKLYRTKKAMLEKSTNYWDYLTPDIYMVVKFFENGGKPKSINFIMDAKYKNYESNNYGKNIRYLGDVNKKYRLDFFDDLFDVAMLKYHHNLQEFWIVDEEQKHKQVKMSFILHPNSLDDFCWLGERSIILHCNESKFMHIEPKSLREYIRDYKCYDYKSKKDKYPFKILDGIIDNKIGHTVGSATLRPVSLGTDIRRLFTLIFHYHFEFDLTNVCLHCGHELHNKNEFLVYPKAEKDEYKSTQLTRQLKEIEDGLISQQAQYDTHGIYIDKDWRDDKPTKNFQARCSQCETQWIISECTGKHNMVKVVSENNLDIHFVKDNQVRCPKCGKAEKIN